MSGTSHPGMPFNPYKAWLGIEATERKPTHYELLGLAFGVVDAGAVKSAVLERSAKVRHYQAGKHADLAAQLLDELAEAQLVLTDRERKRQYDLSLSSSSRTSATGPSIKPTDPVEKSRIHQNNDPERVVKVHSVKMNLDNATGYGLKAQEARDSRVEFISSLAKPQPKAGKRRWYLYGVAFSTAGVISVIIAAAAWMAIEKTNLDSFPNQILGSSREKPTPGFGIASANQKSDASSAKSMEGTANSGIQPAGPSPSGKGDSKPTNPASDSRESGKDSPPPTRITNSIGMPLALIPKGKFQMGSPETEKAA